MYLYSICQIHPFVQRTKIIKCIKSVFSRFRSYFRSYILGPLFPHFNTQTLLKYYDFFIDISQNCMNFRDMYEYYKFILDILWICSQNITHLFSIYYKFILKILQMYSQNILNILQIYSWKVTVILNILWIYSKNITTVFLKCYKFIVETLYFNVLNSDPNTLLHSWDWTLVLMSLKWCLCIDSFTSYWQ